MPRLTLLRMLESAIAVGLTTILLSTVDVVERWSREGRVPDPDEQRAWPLLIDCSGSADPTLRGLSEQSSDLIGQQLTRLSTVLMYMRLLEFYVVNESDISRQDLPARAPNGVAWLNLLGSVAVGSHDESRDAERFFRGKARALADALKEDDPGDPRIDILVNEDDGRKHGLRLAEVLMSLLDVSGARKELTQILYSSLMTNEPNGLARRRRTTVSKPVVGGRKTSESTSFVLTNTALEYLVHRHLRKSGKGRKARDLSLPEFLRLLSERYGFYVDQSPTNMEVPNELLQRNRRMLERRLRDLGLLVGVNDAERMKKLKARYSAAYDVLSSGADAA
jgi:hypothetical protein